MNYPDMLQAINEALSLALATAIGIKHYRWMNAFFKVLLVQLLAWDLFYIGARIIAMAHQDNGWWFNIYLPVEAACLSAAAYIYFSVKTKKRMVLVLYIFYLFAYIFLACLSGFRSFNNYGGVTGGIVMTVLYMMILREAFAEDKFSWRAPETWVCLGLIIYSACTVPYLSMIKYLIIHYPFIGKSLFAYIVDVSANVRYIFLAVAFWQLRKFPVVKTAMAHG